jgi:hypothetical protein
MKFLNILASILLLSQMTMAEVSTSITKKKLAKPAAEKSQLGTSFRFDGSSLRGKYQSSLSTTATVENDKYLDDLLGGRSHFEDRIQQDKERN